MRREYLLITAAALLLAGLACGSQPGAPAINPPTLTPSSMPGQAATDQSTQPAGVITISKVTMFRDDGSGQPGDQVTAFKPSDRVMHFLAEAQGVQPGQSVRLVFTAVDTTAGKDLKVAEADTGKVFVADQITGQVSLDRDWPVGSYKMDIYVDGSLVYTWDYTVES